MATAVLTGFASVPLLAAIGLVNGAVAAVAQPASYSITPETVPADLLQPANAILRIGTNSAAITGASLGGLLAATAGPGWAMVVIAAVFAAEAWCYARVGGVRVDRPRANPLTELREGWSEFVSRRWVWLVVLQFMIVNAAVVGGMQVLGPTVADETFARRGDSRSPARPRARWSAVSSRRGGCPGGRCCSGSRWSWWRRRRCSRWAWRRTSPCCCPPCSCAGWRSSSSRSRGTCRCRSTCQARSWRGCTPTTCSARTSRCLPGSSRSARWPWAAGPVATLVGCAVLIVVVTGAALTSREIRTLRRRSPVREPNPL